MGQPETLITPRAGFHEQQKIVLYANGEKLNVQLQRQLPATGSFGHGWGDMAAGIGAEVERLDFGTTGPMDAARVV